MLFRSLIEGEKVGLYGVAPYNFKSSLPNLIMLFHDGDSSQGKLRPFYRRERTNPHIIIYILYHLYKGISRKKGKKCGGVGDFYYVFFGE